MTGQLLTIATAVLAPAILGAGVVRCLGLRFRAGRRVFLAYSYLVGQLLLAPLTFAWLAAGQPGPGVLLPVFGAAVGGGLLAVGLRRRRDEVDEPARPLDWRAGTVLAIASLILLAGCIDLNFGPIVGGDEGLIWNSKARLLYTAPDFALDFGLAFHVVHQAYPLFDPLVQVLAFAGSGEVLPFESRIPVQAFSFALLLLMSGGFVNTRPRWLADLAILAFATSETFLSVGATACADAMLAFCILGAGLAYLRWQAGAGVTHFRLMALALGAAVATKNEGVMLALVLAIAALLQHAIALFGPRAERASTWQPARALRREWSWLLVPIAILAAGQGFNSSYDLVTDLVDPRLGDGMGLVERSLTLLPENGPEVLRFYAELLGSGNERWLVLIALVAVPFAIPRIWRTPRFMPAIALLGALLAYMLVFIGTTNPLLWHLLTAARRTVLHVTPLAALVLVACADALFQKPEPATEPTP